MRVRWPGRSDVYEGAPGCAQSSNRQIDAPDMGGSSLVPRVISRKGVQVDRRASSASGPVRRFCTSPNQQNGDRTLLINVLGVSLHVLHHGRWTRCAANSPALCHLLASVQAAPNLRRWIECCFVPARVASRSSLSVTGAARCSIQFCRPSQPGWDAWRSITRKLLRRESIGARAVTSKTRSKCQQQS